MIKTVIMGTGRMGSLIRTTAESIVDAAGQPVFDIVAQIGFDLSELENAPAADVIIDFSNVATFDAVVAYVERTGAALVSGTTGYTPEQMDRLRELGQNTRVMHSGNYSIGIAALRHLVAQATRELPGFDCEIVETHHNQKVDAPSGTAKLLLDAVVEAEPEAGYHPVYGREGMCGARDPKEIGMHSLRGGTVAGVHEVSFFGQDEEVTLHEPSDLCQRRPGSRAEARRPRTRLLYVRPGHVCLTRYQPNPPKGEIANEQRSRDGCPGDYQLHRHRA